VGPPAPALDREHPADIGAGAAAQPSPDDLEHHASGGLPPPDNVHVHASVEVSQGTPYLDFAAALDYTASGHFERSPERLQVTSLARFAQQVGRHGLAPTVILDILTPPARYEVMRQLVLRNEFAHQLLALGAVQSIVATGVGSPAQQEQAYTRILRSLRESTTPAAIAGRLASALPGTALLTLLPPAVQPPIGA
jgi:hypothetical protein